MRRALFVLLLIASGCATQVPEITDWKPEMVAQKCLVRRDDFKKLTTVRSPKIFFGRNDVVMIQQFWLEAVHSDNGDLNYFCVIYTQRGYDLSWAFWKDGYDQNGRRFPLRRDDSVLGLPGCVREIASAIVPKDYLDDLRKNDIRWRVYGERATNEFTITSNLVDGFLSRCEKQFGSATTSTF